MNHVACGQGRKVNTRFGIMEAQEEDILEFESPILGFENLRYYTLITLPDYGPFLWLQSVEDANTAFAVLDPLKVFPNYVPELPPVMGEEAETPLVLSIVTHDGEQLGLNLLAPLVIRPRAQKGGQTVLSQPGLTTFHGIQSPTAKED